jgi:S1-C subfamily serine protease
MRRFLIPCAAFVLAGGLGAFVWQMTASVLAQVGGAAQPLPVTPRGPLGEDEQATIALFEKARASVVYIATTERVLNPWTRNIFQVPRGAGSGFIWDNRGHVVTNAHVVAGASAATVRLVDGRAFEASLVGTSPSHDLAVLRISIPSNRPPPLPIGTSGDLRVGQKVFAIGNPFGLDWTLTTGIVSALDRELPAEGGGIIERLIQTDAAINPGNSGGPLLDSAGRLIGVNTAIYSPSGASAGIGFAVPVDTVNRVVPRLIAQGRYVRPTLGIRVEEQLNAALSARLGVTGVFVLEVEPGSPAERAGIRPARLQRDGSIAPGDVIVALSGRTLRRVADLLSALDERSPGETVTVSVLRDGRRIELATTLGSGR